MATVERSEDQLTVMCTIHRKLTSDAVGEQVARVVEHRPVHERHRLLRGDGESSSLAGSRSKREGCTCSRRRRVAVRRTTVGSRVAVFGPLGRERVQVVVGRDGWHRAVCLFVLLQKFGVDELDGVVCRVDMLRNWRFDRSEVVGQGSCFRPGVSSRERMRLHTRSAAHQSRRRT